MRVVILLLLAVSLAGCVGLAGTIDALAKDPNTACLSIGTPYGSIASARTGMPGTRVTMQGGACTVETSCPNCPPAPSTSR